MSRFQVSAATHVGHVRRINEDRILSLPDHCIWVVADGMGGHAAGDFAAETLVGSVSKVPRCGALAEQERWLHQAMSDAHNTIQDEVEIRKTGTIGAAVVALIASDDRFICLWAGDCRLYRFRSGEMQMLTVDHSVVADLVRLGELSWDEAEHHPQSNLITRAVGVGNTLDLETVEGSLKGGDVLVLCSDGLNKYADLETLRATLAAGPVEQAADRLLQTALDGGGSDNISVIVIGVT